ncbi:GNAT family N-acetyltransferase [Halobacteriales archaeon QS_4_62_28]|nr:MAG: GNAT family N-acetyltransferase [Halobacteriales archaeon QS_4_62_28]
MSVEIRAFEPEEFDRWNGLVDQSPNTNVFHRAEALQLQAQHAGATLHPLVGFKGQEPVGIWPLFELKKGPFTAVFSPPPPLWIHRLGPAMVNMEKLKQRKMDRRTRDFVDGCLQWLTDNCGPKYVRVTTEVSFRDVRPFEWNDADVTPAHTYVVDLTPEKEELLMTFSSDARKNARTADDEYTIELGDPTDVDRIIEQVQARYRAQGKAFNFPTGFARDLAAELPEGRIRPYCCYYEGEYVGGILTYEDDWIYRWHGGVKTDIDLPVNDLLDWHIMTDAMERGIEKYDLVGADDRRISSYKAKFGPALQTFYTIERSTLSAKALLGLYRRLQK